MSNYDKASLSSKHIPESYVIDNIYEIEDVLVAINKIDKEIEFLKGLKQNRVKSIEEEITAFEEKYNWLRKLALESLKTHSPKDKTVNFPGVAKVTRKIVKGSWSIDDEKEMLDFFETEGMKDEVVIVKPTVDKKKAKEILEHFGKLRINVPGTKKSEDYENLSITFESDEAIEEKVNSLSSENVKENIDSLDTIDL